MLSDVSGAHPIGREGWRQRGASLGFTAEVPRMTPLPTDRPRVWLFERNAHAVTLKASRSSFERQWGPPHRVVARDEGRFQEAHWGWRSGCGLELVVVSREADRLHVFIEPMEVDHAMAHLGLKDEVVEWRADAGSPLPREGWVLTRMDETGNRYDVAQSPERAHVACFARILEERAHKQSYYVEFRGTPAHEDAARKDWAVIRQDEYGNRAEVARLQCEQGARAFADVYEADPRHKQTYFVEPVAPRP
ncbi:hypothetical protein HNV28_30465 [Myxococcus xanthus]|uniref:Uncharacterized protein n=2 Tax=Myxococcus xanthus TaxID=34 RepID=A0A7Y4INV7_MYXXA|nr:hypothetical protein [Myxococcus xanthus]NOJ89987.1 hypothetical protein [Myxococcus xanthus]